MLFSIHGTRERTHSEFHFSCGISAFNIPFPQTINQNESESKILHQTKHSLPVIAAEISVCLCLTPQLQSIT
jgi:hypothetical protein